MPLTNEGLIRNLDETLYESGFAFALFCADVSPSSVAEGGLEPFEEASWEGYERVTPSVSGDVQADENGVYKNYNPVEWTPVEPEQPYAYGVAVVRISDEVVVDYVKFPSPLSLADGATISVNLRFRSNQL